SSAASSSAAGPSAGAPASGGGQPPRWQPPRREAEPIDLLETAGLPVLKRALPVFGGLALLGAVVWWWRRR
ncbi:MAG: SRPBCC family protein, partial [Actinomycetes bacterium]